MIAATFHKPLLELAYGRQNVFSDFLEMVRCALSFGTKEDRYLEIAGRYKSNELTKFAQACGQLTEDMERHEFVDLLGPCYMEHFQSKGGRDGAGEFYTPHAVCKCLAKLTCGKPETYPVRIQEPACGAGQIILSVAETYWYDHKISPRNLRVTAIDVSRTAALMCWINTTLWNIPTQVVWGNTLTLETHEVMPNPWYPHPLLELINNIGAAVTEPKADAEYDKPRILQPSLFGVSA